MIRAIDHVRLAMPVGGEPSAWRFYGEALGLAGLARPPSPAVRGGVWFGGGPVQWHPGVEDDFRPAREVQPGLLVDDLDAVLARLRALGVDIRENRELPGLRRVFLNDPFGNRIELIQP